MLFTKEIGIEEIINQIMFGFVKKNSTLCFIYKGTLTLSSYFESLCLVSVRRLQQNVQTAQGRCTVIGFELRARPKSSHVLKDTYLNVQSLYNCVFAFNLKREKHSHDILGKFIT